MSECYTCPRCHYSSKIRSNLYRHLRSVKACDTIYSDIEREQVLNNIRIPKSDSCHGCTICGKQYVTRQGLHWHLKKHEAPVEDKVIAVLRQEIEELKKEMAAAKCTNQIQNIHTQNNCQTQNNIQNQQNIIINAFGNEDVSYISSRSDFKQFMIKCLKMRHAGLCEYISSKHFHEDHPENHNIRKLNKKDNIIEYHDGKKWRINLKEYVINEIMRDVESEFKQFVETSFSDTSPLSKDAQIAIDHYMEAVGVPFEWDLDCKYYTYDDSVSDDEDKHRKKEREELKKRLYDLAIEHIYRESKKVHKDAS
jgi:hypothetical protein